MDKNLKSNVKNARKCENLNDPIDTYVVDYAAMAFSKAFIALVFGKTPVSSTTTLGCCGSVATV